MVSMPRWQVILVLAICAFGFILASPNLFERKNLEDLPSWMPQRVLNLGLDLQGGSHLLIEVDVADLVDKRLASAASELRKRLRNARIRRDREIPILADGIRFRPVQDDQRETALEIARDVAADLDDGGGLSLLSTGPQGVRVLEEDGGWIKIQLNEDTIPRWQTQAVEQSIDVIRRRVDETGVREPTIQRQGQERILLQVPGFNDPERLKDLIGRTAQMTFHLVDEEADPSRRPPPGRMVLTQDDGPSGISQDIVLHSDASLGGEHLIDSQVSYQNGAPVVTLRFDTTGARIFGDLTRENVGRRFAIVLDEDVVSAPVIRAAILGGNAIIEGNFTVQDASDLSLVLRSGALPADLTFLEERSVGPGLGQDSIDTGKIAAVLGLIGVVVFMIASYGLFGIFANIALAMNLTLMLAALSMFQATLTLPGIAGIVLTIGMAVDANVLIFERIREEIRAGRAPISAVDSGYRRALSTIVDANLTTFIAAVMLFLMGSGPVKGFAVTLSIGLATSMFSAIMFTRLMVVVYLRRRRPKLLPI